MPCLAMAPDEVDRPALVEAAARGAAAAGGSRQVVAAAVAAAIRAAATLGAAETADVFGLEHAPSPIQAEIILAAREAHDLLARQLGVPHHSLAAAVRAARADGAVDRSLADRLNRLSVASDILRHTTAMGVSKLLGDLRMVLKQGHRKEPKGQGAQPKHEEKAAAKLVAEEDLTRLVAEAQEKAAAKPAAANEQPQDDVPAADGPAADEAAENAKPEERSKQEKKAAAEKAAGEMAARCAAAEEKAARCAAINERVRQEEEDKKVSEEKAAQAAAEDKRQKDEEEDTTVAVDVPAKLSFDFSLCFTEQRARHEKEAAAEQAAEDEAARAAAARKKRRKSKEKSAARRAAEEKAAQAAGDEEREYHEEGAPATKATEEEVARAGAVFAVDFQVMAAKGAEKLKAAKAHVKEGGVGGLVEILRCAARQRH